ncbi:MAG: hypothetical protein ACLR07_14850 [Christensenellales bacterium]
MLRRCICAENRKLHASPIWLMFLILPIISAGYGTFNYLQNLEILTDGWYSLWTQHTLFYSLFFIRRWWPLTRRISGGWNTWGITGTSS